MSCNKCHGTKMVFDPKRTGGVDRGVMQGMFPCPCKENVMSLDKYTEDNAPTTEEIEASPVAVRADFLCGMLHKK